MKITRQIASRVLEVVDAGLVCGVGEPIPGKMCVEAAVCFALGEPHGDEPSCVGTAVRAFKINLNDAAWSSNAARAKGMRELAIAQLGSDTLNQKEFSKRLALSIVKNLLPRMLRSVNLPDHADKCASVTTLAEAESAARYAASAASDAASAARYAARYAASDATSDSVLSFVARLGTQVLLDMDSPGSRWLGLTL